MSVQSTEQSKTKTKTFNYLTVILDSDFEVTIEEKEFGWKHSIALGLPPKEAADELEAIIKWLRTRR